MNKPHEATPTELRVALAAEREVCRMLEHELTAERSAHAKTRRDLRVALIVGTFNAVLMIVLAIKYLHVVDLPKARCLHPANFAPTFLELATVTEAPRTTV
jgi:hypothetical protein